MTHTQQLELDHDDHDRTRYRGLSHSTCNRAAGGRKSHWKPRRAAAQPQPNPSRDW